MVNEKNQLRKKMKDRLSLLTEEIYKEYSQSIQSTLFTSKEWRDAGVIGITLSRFPEVETRGIIEKAWMEGKEVVVPKCYPKDKTMEFYYLHNFEQLETVYFGLKEPKPTSAIHCQKENINLMLVPGLVFDRQGFRIGFGGGYYDRYLATFTGRKISLAFSEQILEKVPRDGYDIPVHKIITNEAVYECTFRD